MLFLLRSAFWLGLAFTVAPGAADDPRRESAAKAASAAVLAAGDLAASIPGQAEASCRKAPKDCMAIAQKVASVSLAKSPLPLPLAGSGAAARNRDAKGKPERQAEPRGRTTTRG